VAAGSGRWPLFVLGGALAFVGCAAENFERRTTGAASQASDSDRFASLARDELRAFEETRRADTDFATGWAEDGSFGADPQRIVALSPGRWLGLLRGSSALVLLDDELRERARSSTPRRPLAVAARKLERGAQAFVVGALEPSIQLYDVGESLMDRGSIRVPGVSGLSSIAVGPADTLYVASEESEHLFVVDGANAESPTVRTSVWLCHGPHTLGYAPGYLVANCLLEHALVVVPVDAGGEPAQDTTRPLRIVHDGPFWGFSLAKVADRLLIAATGVEDHPLDRSIGSFGYIDSFLYVYG
jgi:hypothetical protein